MGMQILSGEERVRKRDPCGEVRDKMRDPCGEERYRENFLNFSYSS